MRRVVTVDDFERDEYRRTKNGVLDPLEDSTLPLVEKQRLATMFEIVQQTRASHALMHERLLSLFAARTPMLGQTSLFSSALQMACLYGDLNFAKMLVSRGENIDEVTMSPDNFGRGRCPMSVAAELGHNHILEFLIASGGDTRNMHDPPLRQAVRRNDVSAVTMLVKGGADPDPTLHQLLWPSCNTAVIRMLLDAGANPSGTMLLTALWRGCDAAVIELLLNFGAPFRSDLENESALEVAICRGADKAVVEALLAAPARWVPHRHKMYPRTFQQRVFSFLCVNNRMGGSKLPQPLVVHVTSWIAKLEKKTGDVQDLQRSILSVCDEQFLQTRLQALGLTKKMDEYPSEERGLRSSASWHDLASYEYRMSNKAEMIGHLNAQQLLKVLWFEEQPVARSRVAMNGSHSEATLDAPSNDDIHRGGYSLFPDYRGDEEEDDDDDDDDDDAPYRERSGRKRNGDEDDEGGGLYVQPAQQRKLPKPHAEPLYKRLALNSAQDARNPNSPKPHHCTCCHVCHVSMKQRPRPIAACSLCNTIICKLCLQDRWKSDQWEEACTQAGWVCHKCKGSCVCKSCKSKGSRMALGGSGGNPVPTAVAASGR